MPRAYDDAIWTPGEPTDPSLRTMGRTEISDRLLFIERALDRLQVGDLPLSGLMRTLEQTWLPDPSTLFPSGSIDQEAMAFSWVFGQVSAAGAVQLPGSGKWSVVRNGAGDYTITFPQFRSVPIIVAMPVVSSVTGFRATAVSVTTAQIVCSGDTDFNFWIVGK